MKDTFAIYPSSRTSAVNNDNSAIDVRLASASSKGWALREGTESVKRRQPTSISENRELSLAVGLTVSPS